ncbi:hypothetical protein MMC30_004111 [Trapelia coarctata]|nr:hypothetical protein [Trapelia coarctata]
MSLSRSAPFLAILLYSHLVTSLTKYIDGDQLMCPGPPFYKMDDIALHSGPDPKDCRAAIAVIPDGQFTLDIDHLVNRTPDPAKSISLVLNNRKYLFPAAFIAGSCVVKVQHQQVPGPRPRPRPPVKAASAMTFTVWPKVRKIVRQESVWERKKTGIIWSHSTLDNWKFTDHVAIIKVPQLRHFRGFYAYHDPRFGETPTLRRQCAHLAPVSRIKPAPADCRAALDMIPDGKIELGGRTPAPNEPMEFWVPNEARVVFAFPAIFRSGTCAAYAGGLASYTSHGLVQLHPHHVENFASAAYFTLWPNVRHAVGEIMKECIFGDYAEGRGGNVDVSSVVEGNEFRSRVHVYGIRPQALLPPPTQYQQGQAHVYQVDLNGRVVLTGD